MKDIKIDDKGNFVIINGSFQLSEYSEYLKQKIQIKLKWFLGEWFLNTLLGIDYFGMVFVKNPDIDQIENILKNEILTEEDVDDILEFSTTLTDRNLIINTIMVTTQGMIVLENMEVM